MLKTSLQKISDDVVLGKETRIMDFVNLYGCTIGDETLVGTFVEIQRGVVIGSRCKIQSHSFICSGVVIGDGVFIGHGVMFINDKRPRATTDTGNLENASDWKDRFVETYIGNRVSIGSNATIMGGLTIGEGAIIGAGAVVVSDVPPNVTVVGNPARIIVRKPE